MKRYSRLLLMTAAGAALATGAYAQNADGPIRIGSVVSASGPGASVGSYSQAAWQFAIEEINAAGGILGRKVEWVRGDTQTDPTHGVSEARRLIENEGVVALVGPATSQETIPIATVATEKGIVQFSTAGSPLLTPQTAPYHFSSSPTGLNQMAPNVDYALDVLKISKLGLLSDNGGMSKAGIQDIIAYLDSKGIKPVAVQEFAFKAEDITPQLLSMRRDGVEAILLINSIYPDTVRVLENREDIGWDVPILANITTTGNSTTIAGIVGEAALANVYGTQFRGLTYCPGDPEGQSDYAKYVVRARAAIPDIDKIGGPATVAMFYVGPMVIKAGMDGAGTTDGKAVAAWLESQPTINTVLGPLSVSSKSHFLPSAESLAVVREPHKIRADGTYLRAKCD